MEGPSRAIAFGIYWPVTQVKTGVQCAQNEDNGSFAADSGSGYRLYGGGRERRIQEQKLKCGPEGHRMGYVLYCGRR